VPTLALYGINEDSAGNYLHMDEESTVRIGFCRELSAHKQGIHLWKGIPLGIISLFTRIQVGKIKMCGNSFKQ
jgi:hypothetical protein